MPSSCARGKGKESKLSFGGHALMENRHGLCVDLKVTSALDTETEAAKAILERQRRKRVRPSTLGADKGYHNKILWPICVAARSLRTSP